MTFLYLHPIQGENATPDLKKVSRMGEVEGRQRYLSGEEMPDGFELVGQWKKDGRLITVDLEAFELYFQKFENKDGAATGDMNIPHWQGHGQRQMQDTGSKEEPKTVIGDPRYPAEKQPYALHMEHDDEDAMHSWKCTIISADPKRNVEDCSIGVYDEMHGKLLYTVAAFSLTDIGEVDKDDQPVMKLQARCPKEHQKDKKEPLYFALINKGKQEGKMVLPVGRKAVEANFWEEK